MTLFGRYIFRQAFSALVLILLSLTAIVWIAMALKQLNLMTSGGQSSWIFFEITLLILPDIIAIIAPIALLIAALHTLNRMNGDSELIVMTAAGATVWQFAKPLLLVATLVTGWLIAANFLVTPWSLRALNDVFNQVRTDLISQVLQPGQFASPEEGLTFHIRERNSEGHLLGLILSDTRSQSEQMTYLANTGDIVKRADKAFLVLHEGQIVRRPKGQDATIIEFDSYVLDLSTITERGQGEGPKPHARYLSELLNPDPADYFYTTNPGVYRAELHERFASLLYPFAFVAIVVAFLGQARTTRQSRSSSQVAAFTLAAGLKLGGIAATNLLASEPLAMVLVYGLPVTGLGVASFAAYAAMAPRNAKPLPGWIAGPLGACNAALGRLMTLPMRLASRRGAP